MIRSRTSPVARGLLALVATVLAAVGAGYAIARFIGPFPRLAVFESPDRRHLDEIPIDPADACGMVETIHEALGSFNVTYTAATFGLDAQTVEALLGTGSVSSSTSPTT